MASLFSYNSCVPMFLTPQSPFTLFPPTRISKEPGGLLSQVFLPLTIYVHDFGLGAKLRDCFWLCAQESLFWQSDFWAVKGPYVVLEIEIGLTVQREVAAVLPLQFPFWLLCTQAWHAHVCAHVCYREEDMPSLPYLDKDSTPSDKTKFH